MLIEYKIDSCESGQGLYRAKTASTLYGFAVEIVNVSLCHRVGVKHSEAREKNVRWETLRILT